MSTQNLSSNIDTGDLKTSDFINPDTEPLGAGYKLSPEQATLFKRATGIDNDEDLKTHILKVQENAYQTQIFPYLCIRWFTFLEPGIAAHPEYERIIKLGKERPKEVLLDIGCCFGVDARRVVSGGFPLENVVTTDLVQAFHDMGHALFNTTPETYPITFVPGDVFDPNTLQIVPPFNKPPVTERPNLSALASLNPLAGHCSVIYASNIFHLFSEEKGIQLAKALAGLLSPEPGSMICGEQATSQESGILQAEHSGKVGFDVFLHSPESWSAIWDGIAFAKGSVRVVMDLGRAERPISASATFGYLRLKWSVVRL